MDASGFLEGNGYDRVSWRATSCYPQIPRSFSQGGGSKRDSSGECPSHLAMAFTDLSRSSIRWGQGFVSAFGVSHGVTTWVLTFWAVIVPVAWPLATTPFR